MTEWVNRFRELMNADESERKVIWEWRCTCAPDTRTHQMMVMGALRNANLDEFYLEDGVVVVEET